MDEIGESGANEASPEDIDPGEPIEMLRDLAEEPAAGFLARIRDAIQRRSLFAQLADLSWFTPVLVLFEYVGFFFGLFETMKRKEGDRE